jgi:HEAT repeat protein
MTTMCKRAILVICCWLTLVALAPAAPAADESKLGQKVPKESRSIPPVPPLKVVPINPQLQAESREVIKAGLSSQNRIIRAHAIEASKEIWGDKAKADILRGLRDPESIVRFAAAMAIGDAKIASVKDEVLKLVDDNDPSVRVAVRYALHRLGDYRFSHDLERTASDPDPAVRGNTAIVLGRMENASALKVIAPMRKDLEPAVRLQAAEAMWRLGDERGLKALVAASISAYPDDVIIAFLAMSASKDHQLLDYIETGLNNDYPQIALAAARACGELGSDAGYGVALEGARSKDGLQRYMAAVALGSIGRVDSQDALATLLHDKESEDIRLAAAYSLLQIGEGRGK